MSKRKPLPAGTKFGKLTIVDFISDCCQAKYLCQCDCGKQTEVFECNLTRGLSQTCGHNDCRDIIKPKRRVNKVGQKFGKLTVREMVFRMDKPKGSRIYFICDCECGGEIMVYSGNVRETKYNSSCGCSRKATKEKHAARIFNIYKKEFEKRNRAHYENRTNNVFELTIEDVNNIIFSNCFYCDVPPCNQNATFKFQYNGIDRVDNSKGYSKDNCVPCCKICNYAKNKLPLKDFISWIERLSNYQRTQGFLSGKVPEKFSELL